jgi:hypothetical protein
MKRLGALVVVDRMIADASQLLNQAISTWRSSWLSAPPPSTDADTDADNETLVPTFRSVDHLTREDTTSIDLAQCMIEAGLGLLFG